MSDVLWRRLRYMLTPQFDIYLSISDRVEGQTVLDVGCGTGFGSLQLARRAKHVNAFDIDDEAANFAFWLETPNLKVVPHSVDLCEYMPFKPHDAVVMVEVLEHIPDWRVALGNVQTLLAPGGKLYISARNRNADLRRNDLHEREWTAAEFKAALAGYFSSVTLYDYSLEHEQGDDTRVTPLVAVCVK